MLRLNYWLAASLVLPATFFAHVAFAETPDQKPKPPQKASSDDEPLHTWKLKIHPAPATTPAIRYRFTPRPLDQEAGNAALSYLNAAILMSQLGPSKELDEEIDDIRDSEKPWDRDRIERAEKVLRKFSLVLDQVRMGAKQRDCVWVGDLATLFETPITPELQQLRAIARLLASRIHLDLARGDLDHAAATMQVSLTYARHIAEGPTLIHALIGIAIDGMLIYEFHEMAQLADCPNLYWSLAAITNPPISIRRGLDIDADGVYFVFPKLRHLASQQKSPAQWSELLQETLDWFFRPEHGGLAPTGVPWSKDMPRTSAEMIAKYGKKSIEFLKSHGNAEAELEKMPEAKAVLLHTTIRWDEVLDDTFRWSYLPYWQAHAHVAPISTRIKPEDYCPIPMAESIRPAVAASMTAQARLSRQFTALRVIEAIRDFVYHHDGQLPKSLDDIKDLPLPIDPYTGKPFEYRLEKGKAILDGPPPDKSSSGIHAQRWEIEIAEPKK